MSRNHWHRAGYHGYFRDGQPGQEGDNDDGPVSLAVANGGSSGHDFRTTLAMPTATAGPVAMEDQESVGHPLSKDMAHTGS